MVEKSQFWAEQVDGSIFSIPMQRSSVSGKVEKEILIASVHLSQAFFPYLSQIIEIILYGWIRYKQERK